MTCYGSSVIRQFAACLVTACLGLGAAMIPRALGASGSDASLAAIASEARQTIAVIDWFYVRSTAPVHSPRAQPSWKSCNAISVTGFRSNSRDSLLQSAASA